MRKILAAIIAFSIVMTSASVFAEENKVHDATCFLSTAEAIKDGTVQDLTVSGKTKYPGAYVRILHLGPDRDLYETDARIVVADNDGNYSYTFKDFAFNKQYPTLSIRVSSEADNAYSAAVSTFYSSKTIDFKEDEVGGELIHKILSVEHDNHTDSTVFVNPATDIWGESRYPYAKITISYLACDGNRKTITTTAREDGMFFAFLPDVDLNTAAGRSTEEVVVVASSDETNEKCVKAKDSEQYPFEVFFPIPSQPHTGNSKKVTLKFTKKKVKINKGKKITLKLKARNLRGIRVKYSVNKKSVIKLSKKKNTGVVVKGLRKGKAIIKAKARGKITTCTVVVK